MSGLEPTTRTSVGRASFWWATSVVLALVAALSVVVLVHGSPPAPAGTPRADVLGGASARGGRVAGPVTRVRPVGSVSHSRPRPHTVRIPAIGLVAPVGQLGLNRDGTVQVPSDPARTGWYRLGPRPGSRGSSVILGHVDSVDGPAVFAGLSTLRPGDHVTVELGDRSTVHFRVRSVRTYPNERFPDHRVYGRPGWPKLNLVTCGGGYDTTRGGYQGNVVVYTTVVHPGPHPQRQLRTPDVRPG